MAKQKQVEPKKESVGSLMSGRMTTKERNLLVKAKLIESGELEEVPIEKMGTTKERNLYLKAKLEKDGNKD